MLRAFSLGDALYNPAALPNAPEQLAPLAREGRIPKRRVWLMLALRSVVSFSLLLALGAAFAAQGSEEPLKASAAWWLWFVTLTNVLTVYLLARFARAEGLRLRDIYYVSRSTWKGDLLWLALGLAVTAAVAQAPGLWLAQALWGDSAYPNELLFQPLPLLGVYPLFVLMPTIHAFAELPLYWGYVAPRLRAHGMSVWAVILLTGSVLSVQHLFFSFQPDWRYALWLGLKFLPFALWTGYLVYRRPTVLPYMMAAHFALDALLPVLLYLVSTGTPLS